MPLDADIKSMVQAVIKSDLQAPKVPKGRVPKLKKVWKCVSAYDFLYGQRVGYYTGLAEGIMLERHRRQLTQEEQDEIFAAIEPYTKDLRKYFAYYRPAKREKKKK
ncbi:hypothetical protein NTE_02049 [Candidatus Nitrososphaera evergladensis SR1]|jgi:hypothetical protein|uniref:Uncharacterized protein n=1 Tax=Candidatus Nitrososphaera evergladensis SR1 TaxID=1459636 RepID=A0A075MRC5_9ARCH|nr:hypothetical protein [Candidatus Nitrososphaera evergladensis]AIF84106.1 hypothetical protein NTE_02049 [Candidatus Nitrososphaera evergladensis SR1]